MPPTPEAEMLRRTAAAAPEKCCQDVNNLRLVHSSERLRTYQCIVCTRKHHRALMHDLDVRTQGFGLR